MAVPDVVSIDRDPEWPTAARRVPRSVNPNLKEINGSGWDAGCLDDGVGPVYVKVYDSEVQLRPKKFWENLYGIDGFAAMWACSTALGEHAGCIAHGADRQNALTIPKVGAELRSTREGTIV